MKTLLILGATLLGVALVFVCCGRSQREPENLTKIEQRLKVLETEETALDHRMGLAAADVQRLAGPSSWSQVEEQAVDLERQFGGVAAHYDRNAESISKLEKETDRALQKTQDAIQAGERAERIQALMVASVMAIRRVDDLCSQGMSTTAFRKMKEAEGEDLRGKDIDHVVPKSRGGADHPFNYKVTSSSKNRSWGNRFDFEKCHDQMFDCVRGWIVSQLCGSGVGILRLKE